jgi:hypothetical protein
MFLWWSLYLSDVLVMFLAKVWREGLDYWIYKIGIRLLLLVNNGLCGGLQLCRLHRIVDYRKYPVDDRICGNMRYRLDSSGSASRGIVAVTSEIRLGNLATCQTGILFTTWRPWVCALSHCTSSSIFRSDESHYQDYHASGVRLSELRNKRSLYFYDFRPHVPVNGAFVKAKKHLTTNNRATPQDCHSETEGNFVVDGLFQGRKPSCISLYLIYLTDERFKNNDIV